MWDFGIVTSSLATEELRAFAHDALFYEGVEDFVGQIAAVVRDGLARDDAVIVATDSQKSLALRAALGADADHVTFIDITVVGRNPGRIIPVWRELLASATAEGRSVTGVGEPVWSGRSPAALLEAERHETLLNLAFAGGAGWTLVCPYDTGALPGAVLDEARRNHPVVVEAAQRGASDDYLDPSRSLTQLGEDLPEPVGPVSELAFAGDSISDVRDRVLRLARRAGLHADRADDVTLAVHELVTNSVRHGGGAGQLRMWTDEHSLVLEVTDRGAITDPLAGRAVPGTTGESGRGLWLVNQLCDLVQIRSDDRGTTVRVHMHLAA
jgi:anti-sigma regulatory factor (Ser/Thr protein kinase)